ATTETATPEAGVASAAGTRPADGADGWGAILAQLDVQGAARQLASHCALIGRQGGLVRLALDPRHAVVRTRAVEDKLAQALSRFYGETVRVEIAAAEDRAETPAETDQRTSRAQAEAARAALEEDATVRALQERFGATVLPETVRTLK
ncbi:MAG: DNA polymerase III subunit gamma/tau C-terminal domain-containing protein, partial [Steroidobacteraceae bacterium]